MIRNWNNRLGEDDPSFLADMLDAIKSDELGLRNHFDYQMAQYLDHVESLLESCDSPIEQKFLEALVNTAPGHGLPVECSPHHLCAAENKTVTSFGLIIFPQFELKLSKNYRADFLLLTADRHRPGVVRKLIIECDGHDFHERTKEQAARDKSRDRDMTAAGYSIMRFTGSEIHKDAAACADQACTFLSRWR